jgi:hypothetical protein
MDGYLLHYVMICIRPFDLSKMHEGMSLACSTLKRGLPLAIVPKRYWHCPYPYACPDGGFVSVVQEQTPKRKERSECTKGKQARGTYGDIG